MGQRIKCINSSILYHKMLQKTMILAGVNWKKIEKKYEKIQIFTIFYNNIQKFAKLYDFTQLLRYQLKKML